MVVKVAVWDKDSTLHVDCLGVDVLQNRSRIDCIASPVVRTTSQWPVGSKPVNLHARKWTAEYAASLTFLGWGRDPKNEVLKQFVPELSAVEIGSIITNITLPYFTVQSIEWRIKVASAGCPSDELGALELIPDTPWSNQTELNPSKVSKRSLMQQYVAETLSSTISCADDWNNTITFNLSSNRGIYQEERTPQCYRFAWVTYTSGMSICHNCRLAAYATVQNDFALEVMEDLVTEQASRLMPSVTALMLQPKMSCMIPTWETLDKFVVGMLTRSCSESWMALTDHLGAADFGSAQYNAT
ncbi:hypothetical protein B0J17DRAFT_632970 [Rhizoctonia solani]|nr:hypothetical protein B0J17DRAFT_632970 [Rhizoctonia solani]